MKAIDLTQIITKEHVSKWVALSLDHKKLIGSSKDLSFLKTKVGEQKVIYMKIPPSHNFSAFSNR